MSRRNCIQVELAAATQSYLSQLAILHYGSLEKEFDDLVDKFIKSAPWSDWPPLGWKTPPLRGEHDAVRAHISLPDDLIEVMMDTIDHINIINRHTLDPIKVTPRIFLHTAIYWWTKFVYPHHQIQGSHLN